MPARHRIGSEAAIDRSSGRMHAWETSIEAPKQSSGLAGTISMPAGHEPIGRASLARRPARSQVCQTCSALAAAAIPTAVLGFPGDLR
jgi:hypothetical protein